MANRQDDWEKLVHIAEEYEPDPDLGTRTVRELKCSPVKKRKRWPLYRWLSIAACCLVVIGLSVFLPVYFSSRNEIVYYSSDEIEISNIDNMGELEEEVGVDFYYFEGETIYSRVGRIIESGRIAYLEQEGVIISDSNLDIIHLNIVIMSDAEFSFSGAYSKLIDSFTLGNMEVVYNISDFSDSSVCLAKFTYENVDYYMTITTSNGSTETIENYVELLLGI